MKPFSTSVILAFVCLLAAPVANAQSRTFDIRNDGGSRIQFVSDAPLETITGVSSHVTGEVTFDPTDLRSVRGRVAVRVATIRTGVDLRDEHLRGSGWLDATAYPEATIDITSIEGATSLRAGEMARVTVVGRFTLHGHSRDIRAAAQVRLVPVTDEMRAAHIDGDALRVQASFSLRLEDFGVSIPAIVALKVAPTIEVNVTLRAIARAS